MNNFKLTIFLMVFLLPSCIKENPVVIKDWYPKQTIESVNINTQPDGSSAIWIDITGLNYKKPILVEFNEYDGRDVAATPNAVSSKIPPEVISKAGKYNILITEDSGRKTNIGVFEVLKK